MKTSLFTAPLAMLAGAFLLTATAQAQGQHWTAKDPVVDLLRSPTTNDAAFRLVGLATDFELIGTGELIEASDSSARFTAVIARKSDTHKRFEVDLHLSGYLRPGGPGYSLGIPDKDLSPSSYSAQGGPVNTATWRYYKCAYGTLTGVDAYDGALVGLLKAPCDSFQIGRGANNRNVTEGAGTEFIYKVLAQPASGACLPWCFGCGDMAVDLEANRSFCASEAGTNSCYAYGSSHHALYLPGVGTDFVFVSGGRFEEALDGTATLSGVIARAADPTKRFALVATFSGRLDPGQPGYAPAGSPKKELKPGAYTTGGGPIDANSWHYYQAFNGKLTGLNSYAGAVVTFSRFGPSFQVGQGANGKNTSFGASGWLTPLVVSQPSSGPALAFTSKGDINIDLDNECSQCAEATRRDAVYGYDRPGQMLWIPDIGDDFVVADAGQFIERADGTAKLTAIVERRTDRHVRFAVDIDFGGRLVPGDAAYPPPMSPKKLLPPHAYIENGGPIDCAGWQYYTTMLGYMTGQDAMAGAVLRLTPTGPAFQVGFGANNLNVRYGGAGWIDVETLSQPTSGPAIPGFMGMCDINVDLDVDCDEKCVEEALRDCQYAPYQVNHAFWLPGIGSDFVFSPSGKFIEHVGGVAQLEGRIVRASNTSWRFNVDLAFHGRVNVGAPAYPPAGSPKLELAPSAYAPTGPINPGTWHYYQETDGTLTGDGVLTGAVLQVTRFGPSFQVGVGANGKNLHNGASGWIDLNVLHQPFGGGGWGCGGYTPTLNPTGHGDINIDLNDCP